MQEPTDILLTRAPGQPAWHALPDELLGGGLGLSARATMYLLHLLSRPNQTRTSIRSLADAFTEKKTAVSTALDELADAGYLQRVRVRGAGGLFSGWNWQISYPPAFKQDNVKTSSNTSKNRLSGHGLSGHGFTESRESGFGSDTLGRLDKNADNQAVNESATENRLSENRKPDNGEPLYSLSDTHKSAKISDEQSVADALTSGGYRFEMPTSSSNTAISDTLINNTVIVGDKRKKGVRKEGVGENQKNEAASNFNEEQQLIWEQGWLKGYAKAFANTKPRVIR